jgi:hypothetical protein
MPNCITCQCAINLDDPLSFVSFMLPYKTHRKWLVRHYQCERCADQPDYGFGSDSESDNDDDSNNGPSFAVGK